MDLEEETQMDYSLSFDEIDISYDEVKSTEDEDKKGKNEKLCCGLPNVLAYVLKFKRSEDM